MPDSNSAHVLITGASSGLGWGFARQLLGEGAHVYALNRRAPRDLLNEFSERLRFETCDLENFDAIAPALERLLTGVERLDLVILNAGILGEFADMRDSQMEDLRRMMDVNLWSNKVLLDALFARGGQVSEVLAISSGASVNGHRGWNAYSISKAALNMLVKLYAAEVPETHFVSLAPGLIDTDMQEFIARQPDAVVQKFGALERLRQARGTPDMPGPEAAAEKILAARETLGALPSGSFADIRKL